MIVFLMRDWAVKHVYVMWVSWRNIIIINIIKVWQIFVQNILLPVVGIGTLSVLLSHNRYAPIYLEKLFA
jgi:hypothetical protein